MEKILLKPMEVVEALGICRAKTYELLANGTLPSVRIGRSIRIPVTALKQWVEEMAMAPKEMGGSDDHGWPSHYFTS